MKTAVHAFGIETEFHVGTSRPGDSTPDTVRRVFREVASGMRPRVAVRSKHGTGCIVPVTTDDPILFHFQTDGVYCNEDNVLELASPEFSVATNPIAAMRSQFEATSHVQSKTSTPLLFAFPGRLSSQQVSVSFSRRNPHKHAVARNTALILSAMQVLFGTAYLDPDYALVAVNHCKHRRRRRQSGGCSSDFPLLCFEKDSFDNQLDRVQVHFENQPRLDVAALFAGVTLILFELALYEPRLLARFQASHTPPRNWMYSPQNATPVLAGGRVQNVSAVDVMYQFLETPGLRETITDRFEWASDLLSHLGMMLDRKAFGLHWRRLIAQQLVFDKFDLPPRLQLAALKLTARAMRRLPTHATRYQLEAWVSSLNYYWVRHRRELVCNVIERLLRMEASILGVHENLLGRVSSRLFSTPEELVLILACRAQTRQQLILHRPKEIRFVEWDRVCMKRGPVVHLPHLESSTENSVDQCRSF